MTREEGINRNIGLTFDFLRQTSKDPALLKELPDGSILEFVEKDFAHPENEIEHPDHDKKKFLIVKSHFELL